MEYRYDGPRTEVSLSRRFHAAPHAVFDAWIDPGIASRWLFATPEGSTACELDPRPGGSYRITRTAEGAEYVAVGEYLTLDRPRRLAFTFGMPQFAADVGTVTVVLRPAAGGTRMDFTQAGLRPGFERETLEGWQRMFDLLESVLASAT